MKKRVLLTVTIIFTACIAVTGMVIYATIPEIVSVSVDNGTLNINAKQLDRDYNINIRASDKAGKTLDILNPPEEAIKYKIKINYMVYQVLRGIPEKNAFEADWEPDFIFKENGIFLPVGEGILKSAAILSMRKQGSVDILPLIERIPTGSMITFKEEGKPGMTVQMAYLGDIDKNGKIDINDVILALAYLGNLEELEPAQIMAGDITWTGDIEIADVIALLQHIGDIEYIQ